MLSLLPRLLKSLVPTVVGRPNERIAAVFVAGGAAPHLYPVPLHITTSAPVINLDVVDLATLLPYSWSSHHFCALFLVPHGSPADQIEFSELRIPAMLDRYTRVYYHKIPSLDYQYVVLLEAQRLVHHLADNGHVRMTQANHGSIKGNIVVFKNRIPPLFEECSYEDSLDIVDMTNDDLAFMQDILSLQRLSVELGDGARTWVDLVVVDDAMDDEGNEPHNHVLGQDVILVGGELRAA
ncbi:hypothetical protein ONZ45_g17134 [Pleurotus djamor]|nr:hypothetical protein ONZ45_g17134 [Pleurotus djamor]